MDIEEHPEAPSIRAARIARLIMDEVPSVRGDLLTPDVLALLVLLDPSPRTVNGIAEALFLPQSTAAELVDRAEDRGLVRRSTPSEPKPRGGNSRRRGYGDGDDAREVIVTLTAKAKQVRRQRRALAAERGGRR